MTVDYTQLPLGKQTAYNDQYDYTLLVGVPRSLTRDFWTPETPLPFSGEDQWTAYEVSWLDEKGKPSIACLLINYSEHSTNIIESKSLKLYLNSFNQTMIDNTSQLTRTISEDLARIAGSSVDVHIVTDKTSSSLAVCPWPDRCIDELDIAIDQYHVNPELLHCASTNSGSYAVVSHLLRSNCPVTGQPDWASIRIVYEGHEIAEENLLRYICSYRLHQGFHEQCVERIFCDIWSQCQPTKLSVEGRFTRRGGLDINPFRRSHPDMLPTHSRQVRQ